MNYLAHLFLAENNAASRVGSLLGDFVTGRPESLQGQFPDTVLRGIVRHRAIDRFTDSHRVTLRMKEYVAAPRRRFSGVIADLIHDHFLTRHWDEFHREALPDFVAACNAALREHRLILPPELGDSLEQRIEDHWLEHYGTDEGLDGVFRRIALRNPLFAPIKDSIEDLQRHRSVFEAGFRDFFPDLQAWVKSCGPESSILI
ncbi:ACP phosphodiesterase [Luteolibacter sp. GHJ8]|uniref:ACP phosphodiesterase n=1 Tax=Luteolibacter rhizosphaerae TaxID=2989719 RepID=A0ABT3G3T4_9BACT|nr:ACP phosphodiesterase [Luteolibacter rhizosphaerae]MCW1914327.1 ACP phosphodiesterase [Luteolibacter rhizosphaerae]